MNKIFEFTDADFEMLLQALDALKSKDFSHDLMNVMFDGLIKPKEGTPQKEVDAYNARKEKEEKEKLIREQKQKEVNKQIDLLKARITVLMALKASGELEVELKKPERQLA